MGEIKDRIFALIIFTIAIIIIATGMILFVLLIPIMYLCGAICIIFGILT